MIPPRPPFCVATAYIDAADRPAAAALGTALYATLTRDADDPLADGVRIPVYAGVDLTPGPPTADGPRVADRADIERCVASRLSPLGDEILLAIVVGVRPLLVRPESSVRRLIGIVRAAGVRGLSDADAPLPLPGRPSIVPVVVPTDGRWRGEADHLEPLPVAGRTLDVRTGSASAASGWAVVDEVIRRTGDALGTDLKFGSDPPAGRPRLYLSHAPTPRAAEVAGQLIDVATGRGSELAGYFAGVEPWRNGGGAGGRPGERARGGVLVEIRGGQIPGGAASAGGGSAGGRDVVAAKRLGVPVVVVDLPRVGRRVDPPYAGNVPTLGQGDGDRTTGSGVADAAASDADRRGRSSGPADLLRMAVVEDLRSRYFHRLSDRLIDEAGLPRGTSVTARGPELLDLVAGVLAGRSVRTLLHPDPELTPAARAILRGVAPRIHPVTPMTLANRGVASPFGRDDASAAGVDSEEMAVRRDSPLDGIRLALAVSIHHDEDAGGVGGSASGVDGSSVRLSPSGLSDEHLKDAIVAAVRTVVGGGATIAFGGNLSLAREVNFTIVVAELIAAYRQTQRPDAERLRVYLPADRELSEIPAAVQCQVRHPRHSWFGRHRPVIGNDRVGTVPDGMTLSDIRRQLVVESDAVLAIGGKMTPRSVVEARGGSSKQIAAGFAGRFPGVVEEVERHLRTPPRRDHEAAEGATPSGPRRPAYLVGGFGGATAAVVREIEAGLNGEARKSDAGGLSETEWIGVPAFDRSAWDFDHDPHRAALDLPRNLDDAAASLRRVGSEMRRWDDRDWLNWNGLTRSQNIDLWHSVDPVSVARLVHDGLVRWRTRRSRSQGRLPVEVIRGNLASVGAVDLVVVAVTPDTPAGGSAAAVDAATGGAVRRAATELNGDRFHDDGAGVGTLAGGSFDDVGEGLDESRRGVLVTLGTSSIDADLLAVVSLGPAAGLVDGAVARRRLEGAVAWVMRRVRENRLRSLALVTFGGGLLADRHPQAVDAIVGALARESGDAPPLVRWVENGPERFLNLVQTLHRFRDGEGRRRFDVTTATQPPSVVSTRRPECRLVVTSVPGGIDVLPQTIGGGSAVLRRRRVEIDEDHWRRVRRAASPHGGTPDAAEMRRRGEWIGRWLIDEPLRRWWSRHPDAPLTLTVDRTLADVPWECLQFDWSSGASPTDGSSSDGTPTDRSSSGESSTGETRWGETPSADHSGVADADTGATSLRVPAVAGGVVRYLAVHGGDVNALSADQPADRVRVGLVIDPTEDLPGASAEGLWIAEQLRNLSGRLQSVPPLAGTGATIAAVGELIDRVDVLHYCGHHGRVDGRTGLLLADGVFDSTHLRRRRSPPRLVFLDACGSGTVAAGPNHTLAESLMRRGVAAVVATTFAVDDDAARRFAQTFYTHLMTGHPVGRCVAEARGRLRRPDGEASPLPDWCNFVLYGSDELRLA